ncbi:hypothetical protein RB595_008538 [Gaeumannomyces hyphopodioides]
MAAPAPTTKAWTFTKPGEPSSVLALDTAYPKPAFPPQPPVPKAVERLLAEEWVLVRVAYAALNHGTSFYLRVLPAWARKPGPVVPELDFSGVVEDVWDPNSNPNGQQPRLARGDAVCGFIPVSFAWPTGTGALQGYVAIPARFAVKVPGGMPLREAAGLMVAACTALQVVEAAGLRRGGRVLVNAASGGIGSLALQMARQQVGPEGFVVGVCSGKNAELVKRIGADEVVDYQQHHPLAPELKRRYGSDPFDAALDCIGLQQLYVASAGFLAPEGVYSAVGLVIPAWTLRHMVPCILSMQLNALWPRSPWLGGTGRAWRCAAMMDASPGTMQRVADMAAAGELRTVVDGEGEWAFEDVPAALARLESRRAVGKVVVRVGGP